MIFKVKWPVSALWSWSGHVEPDSISSNSNIEKDFKWVGVPIYAE